MPVVQVHVSRVQSVVVHVEMPIRRPLSIDFTYLLLLRRVTILVGRIDRQEIASTPRLPRLLVDNPLSFQPHTRR